MGVNYNPKIITNGLVICLDAANSKSYPGAGTVITDLSGRGNNGVVLSGSTYQTEAKGSLFHSSSVITLAPITAGLTLNNETYTFWARCETTRASVTGGAFSYWIVQFGNYYGNNSGGFGLFQGNFAHYLKGSTNGGWSLTGGSSLANTIYDTYSWIYYTLQIVGNNNLKFFMNNQLIFNSTIADGYTAYGSNNITIGQLMNMTFSNIQIYNRVLSDQELQQNFNATRGRYGN